jgi:hypothetical protein
MAKKKRKYTKRASGTDRKPNRFNEIQRILSAYGKEHNIKFGKGQFAKKAGIINKQIKGFDLKAIEQNIDILYKDYVGEEVKPFRSGEDFAWWYFSEEVKFPQYDKVTIAFTFDDGIQKFAFKGTNDGAIDYFRDVCYRYFRQHYSGSPWAYFKINENEKGKQETDNKTFVNYTIIPGDRQLSPQAKEPNKTPVSSKSVVTPQTSDLIAVEKAKELSAKATIKAEKEKQKTMDKISALMDKGFTKQEIMNILGIK